MIETIRKIGSLGEGASEDVARAVEADLRDTIAQGKSPDGVLWKRTVSGEQPLRNAASSLYVAAVRGTVYVRLKGSEVRHHLGTARGGVARPVIPTSQIPDRMADKIRTVLSQAFERVTSG